MFAVKKIILTAIYLGALTPFVSMAAQLPSIVTLSDHVKHVVAVDLEQGLFTLLSHDQGELTLVKTLPTSIGKAGYDKFYEGDKKTPIGIYRITGYKPEHTLAARYGIGAFPLDYPNAWDKRRQRTGSGIWIHGMDKQLADRPKRDSDGCVVLTNDNLSTMFSVLLDKSTPVILAENTPLDTLIDQDNQANTFIQRFDNWVATWESRDVESYLTFYAPEFANEGKSLEQWQRHKRRVNKQKTFITIETSKLSVFDYPDQANLRLVEFWQDYKSNNYSGAAWKQQFWRLIDGQWQIVYEDTYW